MGLNPFQRAIAWAAEASGVASPADPMDPRFWGQASIGSIAGVTVTPDAALQLGVVQSVLARLAGTLSALPLMVFARDGENRRPAREHPLFRLLHSQPNRTQTAQEFRDQMARDLAWERNFYAWIRPDAAGFPIGELDRIAPRLMTRVFWAGGRRMYDFRDIAGERHVLSEDEIWHIRMAPLTDDALKGRPVYETARETLGRALAVEQFGARFFANSSHAGGVIEHPGRFTDKEAQNEFLQAWRASGRGPNQHADRLLLHGAKYTPPALTNEDSQFIETRKEMNYALASLWNMPGHMVGLLDRATFSNIEQQSIEYAVHTISPPITAIEQSAGLNLLVGPDQDRFFVEFNLSGLLRGDIKTRYAAYAQGRQWGWLSANDVRRLENQDPLGPEGDLYLTPINMATAGQVADDADRGDNPQDPADLQGDKDAR